MPVVFLSFGGAFLVMSFLVLARALREAAYLAVFDAASLPYVTGGVVILGFPLAALFSGALGRMTARRAMRILTLSFAVSVAAIWPWLPDSRVAVVAFYLVTAAGTVLLTSGFWLVVADMLVLREAKRLFGLISAGGTVGMLVTGLAVGVAVQRWDPVLLVPGLAGILVLSAALNEFVPRGRAPTAPDATSGGWRKSVGIVVRQPHVRTLTLIVLRPPAPSSASSSWSRRSPRSRRGG
jgi:AAA family ATP:ADP antiporter